MMFERYIDSYTQYVKIPMIMNVDYDNLVGKSTVT